MENNAN